MKLIQDLREFIALLKKHGINYLVVGGWAGLTASSSPSPMNTIIRSQWIL